MPLLLVGLNHHTAPIAVREKLSIAEHDLPRALAAASACPHVREVVLLSTCNRIETYAVTDSGDMTTANRAVCRFLASLHAVPESEFVSHLYQKTEHEAASHLLRVAAGADSLVVGEGQILGQVRGAMQAAQQAGTSGAVLNALFQQALAGGKRVRAETGLGQGTFSVGRAAVDLAKSIFGNLAHASVLILGAGKMSELTARHLVSSGVRFVIVANRTFERAEELARHLGGKAIQYDSFPEALVTADIVISSTAAPHPIIHRETLAPTLKRRRGKPLFLIDIAVPRDIDPDVEALDNVYLRNIDDLESVVVEDARTRAGELEKAEAIAADEAAKFLAWYRSREAAPVITQLRERLEQIRQDDLAILRARLGNLSEKEWQAIEAATRAMMNRVAREPILRLKQAASDNPAAGTDAPRYDLLAAARAIFGLEEGGSVEAWEAETGAESSLPESAEAAPPVPDRKAEVR